MATAYEVYEGMYWICVCVYLRQAVLSRTCLMTARRV